MNTLPVISMDDYRYELPDDRIAKYPLARRDASKLLLWRPGGIEHRVFYELPDLLTGRETLFFNNTKVIPARMYFRRATGSLIEVFLLSPLEPPTVEQAMRTTGASVWECAVGNLKKWGDAEVLERPIDVDGRELLQRARLADRERMHVRFEWTPAAVPFVRIIEACGTVPIPPYLNRPSEETDRSTYQTVYSKREGAVAAPTAGLHFTPEVLERLRQKDIRMEELTLHVSAGTFKPVKVDNAVEHDMHAEQIAVGRPNVEALLTGRPVVAVGTTSMRTLESLYWYGVRLLQDKNAGFSIRKLEPYDQTGPLPTRREAAEALLDWFDRHPGEELYGDTQIYIFPGYRFQVCDALITNFHQPGSTLLLLVAAFTGGDAWKNIYAAALENDYRFLSYGDSSLLLP